MYSENDISLIIPCYNHQNELVKLLDYLDKKKIYFGEIIVIDSSKTELELNEINSLNKIVYIHEQKCLPGKARNIGIKKSTRKILAFLDCNTFPETYWKYEYIKILNTNIINVILGKCTAVHSNKFNYILKVCSYGGYPFQCLPGTMILKSEFEKVGFFDENSRAGEDVDWINKLHLELKIETFISRKNYLNYYGLPKDFFTMIKKWAIYSFSSSSLNIYNTQRLFYFILFFGLIFYNIYFWNTNLGNWDQSTYYVNNLTKLFLAVTFFVYFIFRSVIRPKKINNEINLFKDFLFIKIFILSFIIDIIKIPGSLIGIFKKIFSYKK